MNNNNNMLQLCRLCLVKDEVNIPIFEEQGDIRQIFLKISSCLPVKVSRDDQLPKKICDGCSYKLDMLYEFWNTSANAEKQLLTWLGEAGMTSQMTDGTISAVAQQIKPADAFVKQETIDPPDILKDDDEDEEDKDYMKQEESSNNATEEPPPKRARRTAAVKAAIALDQNSDEDDDSGEPMTKVEDDSDDSDNDDQEPAFVDAPSTSADDQPGPSGVGKEGVEAPSLSERDTDEDIQDHDNEKECADSIFLNNKLYTVETNTGESLVSEASLVDDDDSDSSVTFEDVNNKSVVSDPNSNCSSTLTASDEIKEHTDESRSADAVTYSMADIISLENSEQEETDTENSPTNEEQFDDGDSSDDTFVEEEHVPVIINEEDPLSLPASNSDIIIIDDDPGDKTIDRIDDENTSITAVNPAENQFSEHHNEHSTPVIKVSQDLFTKSHLDDESISTSVINHPTHRLSEYHNADSAPAIKESHFEPSSQQKRFINHEIRINNSVLKPEYRRKERVPRKPSKKSVQEQTSSDKNPVYLVPKNSTAVNINGEIYLLVPDASDILQLNSENSRCLSAPVLNRELSDRILDPSDVRLGRNNQILHSSHVEVGTNNQVLGPGVEIPNHRSDIRLGNDNQILSPSHVAGTRNHLLGPSMEIPNHFLASSEADIVNRRFLNRPGITGGSKNLGISQNPPNLTQPHIRPELVSPRKLSEKSRTDQVPPLALPLFRPTLDSRLQPFNIPSNSRLLPSGVPPNSRLQPFDFPPQFVDDVLAGRSPNLNMLNNYVNNFTESARCSKDLIPNAGTKEKRQQTNKEENVVGALSHQNSSKLEKPKSSTQPKVLGNSDKNSTRLPVYKIHKPKKRAVRVTNITPVEQPIENESSFDDQTITLPKITNVISLESAEDNVDDIPGLGENDNAGLKSLLESSTQSTDDIETALPMSYIVKKKK